MKSILIIEPSESHQENLRELLELEGYRVISHRGAGITRQHFTKNTPDLVILNEITVNGNTAELISEIDRVKIPLVLLNEDGKSRKKGVSVSLSLPLNNEALLLAIRKVLK